MSVQENWQRLPEELKQRPQWALAGASKAPLSVDANGKRYNTSVNHPSEWLSFNQAVYWATHYQNVVTTHVDNKGRTITQTGFNIGYILNESDEYAIIDADVKDASTHPDEPELWTTPDRFDFYWNKVVLQFDSYTERSRSGKGLHIIVRGKIGPGFKREGIEVYSQERFIIITGDVVLDKPVQERQAMLSIMVAQMRPLPKDFQMEELEEDEDDWSILERAVNAANSDKFSQLWRGEWQQMGFNSQSEADLALMSMFTFYSASNSQCRRLFRDSALGKRDKAAKDDRYLNLTLKIIRERQFRESRADVSALMAGNELRQELEGDSRSIVSLQAPTPQAATVPSVPPPAEVAAAALAPVTGALAEAERETGEWPPGFVGSIAKFIYMNSVRPVKEVSIVAALGLVAGIAGKAWHIPQSGLNMYIILVARSGVGKEAMHTGISSIIHACIKDNPTFGKFVDLTNYVSGPALTKACVANASFVNVAGEWGKRLERLANEDGRDSALQTLRTQMTDLYQKSGPKAIVGGIGYSTTENNVDSVSGVNYSMIGETTPGVFYRALTTNMMEDGFLSRFLVFEYTGIRVSENEYRLDAPDAAMVRALNNMATQADLMISKDYSMPVGRTAEVATLMKQFNLECDKVINSTQDESYRQLYSRAGLKVARLAALLAVADNWMSPVITVEHYLWAERTIKQNIEIMRKRLESGDVGADDTSRERKLVSILKEYLVTPVPASYKVPDAMRENNIVPRSYLQVRINRAPAFSNHRNGANRALDETVQALVDNGYLKEVQKDKVSEAYNYHGKAYRVIKLPNYDEESRV